MYEQAAPIIPAHQQHASPAPTTAQNPPTTTHQAGEQSSPTPTSQAGEQPSPTPMCQAGEQSSTVEQGAPTTPMEGLSPSSPRPRESSPLASFTHYYDENSS